MAVKMARRGGPPNPAGAAPWLAAVVGAALLLGACSPFTPALVALPTPTLTLTPTFLETDAAPADAAPAVAATAGAEPASAAPADGTLTPALEATGTADRTPTAEATAQSSPRPAFDPADWQSLPVIPELSPRALAVLQEGLALGNNPRAFSKIGDCESRTTWFLGDFDLGAQYYNLGPYASELSPVIEFYGGSFNRFSLAANPGFTAASLFSPLWSDRKLCAKNESPIACEYRLQRPSAALIMLGTNDAVNPKTFEGHMRKVIEFSIAQGVLPILGTKADNVEGDHEINQTLARLAYEYDVPLWNYWLAVQALPNGGLQADGAHLTYAAPFFDQPRTLKNGWPVRNLNALQILSRLMAAVE